MRRLLITLPKVIRDNVLVWGSLGMFFIWQYQVPVAVFMAASDWRVEPGSVRATITGWKIRSCEFVKNGEAGYAKFNGQWEEVRFAFERDPSPGSTRPLGRQSFGVWAWSHDRSARPSSVKITVKHMCDGSMRVTEQGPFEVPR